MDVSHGFMVAMNHLFVLVMYLVSQQNVKLIHAHVFMPGLVVFDVSLVDMNPYQFSLCSRSRSYEMV
jgi:hypothetical protein